MLAQSKHMWSPSLEEGRGRLALESEAPFGPKRSGSVHYLLTFYF
jgi:hypothetical protein